jgi:hypothetical protein
VTAERPYRVDWIPAFDAELGGAHPVFLALFYEYVIPVLQYEPTETTGPFTISYEPPYHAGGASGERRVRLVRVPGDRRPPLRDDRRAPVPGQPSRVGPRRARAVPTRSEPPARCTQVASRPACGLTGHRPMCARPTPCPMVCGCRPPPRSSRCAPPGQGAGAPLRLAHHRRASSAGTSGRNRPTSGIARPITRSIK